MLRAACAHAPRAAWPPFRSAPAQGLARRSAAALGLDTPYKTGEGRTARGHVGGMPREKAAGESGWQTQIIGSLRYPRQSLHTLRQPRSTGLGVRLVLLELSNAHAGELRRGGGRDCSVKKHERRPGGSVCSLASHGRCPAEGRDVVQYFLYTAQDGNDTVNIRVNATFVPLSPSNTRAENSCR